MKVGVAWIDVMTGMMGAVAVLAALLERERSGKGQHIDLALFDVGLFALANLGRATSSREPPRRLGNAHAQIVPYGAFPAEDGWLVLAVGNDEQFRRLCQAVGLPELALRFPKTPFGWPTARRWKGPSPRSSAPGPGPSGSGFSRKRVSPPRP